jgi:hypothetical protein
LIEPLSLDKAYLDLTENGDDDHLVGLHDLSLLMTLPLKPFDAGNKVFLHCRIWSTR